MARRPSGWATSRRRERVASGWQQQAEAREILRIWRGVCHWCGKPGADQVDHVVPTSEGGPNTRANKRPIHSKPCHVEKTRQEALRARIRKSTRRAAPPHPGVIEVRTYQGGVRRVGDDPLDGSS